MTDSFSASTLQDFINDLSAKKPVPGGGAVSSLVGAIGTALCVMAQQYTSGKQKFAEHQSEVTQTIEQGIILQNKLLQLADDDAKNFEKLGAAYALEKNDPNRGQAIHEATLSALQAPLQMLQTLVQCVQVLEKASEHTSVMLLSDLACAAILCESAMKSASVNVFVNTATLSDEEKQDINTEVDTILQEYAPRAVSIAEEAVRAIRK